MKIKAISAVIAGCLLAGCASYPISKPLRLAARNDITFERAVKDPNAYKGALVIWGGHIISVVNTSTYTELTVLDTPLGSDEEPKPTDSSPGRFIARIEKFLDPAVFRYGRKVTVAGKIAGQETAPLGKTEYAYPVLDIEELHMWGRDYPYRYEPMFDIGLWYGPGFFFEGHEGMEHRH